MTDASNTFTIAQAAAYLGTTERTVRRWTASGRLPSTTQRDDGGRVLRRFILEADLRRIAEADNGGGQRPDSLTGPRPGADIMRGDAMTASMTDAMTTALARVLAEHDRRQAGPFAWLDLALRVTWLGVGLAALAIAATWAWGFGILGR